MPRKPKAAAPKRVMLVDEKIAFAAKHIRTKEGVRWSLKGREWVRDQFWLPADGYKLWKIDNSTPCATCLDRVGEIIEHPADNPTTACACGGLEAAPILVTILNLERGDGKTFNLMAYSLATIFKAKNKSFSGLWGSENQGTAIFGETWEEAINRDEALRERCELTGTPPTVYVPSTKSRIEVITSSHRSAAGRRRTHIMVDEARDVDARTLMALLPSTNAMHGYECPAGHVQITPEDLEAMADAPADCSVCGRRLGPWWPRVIIASASGLLTGTEKDWLFELCEHLTKQPHKNYHLFTSESWGRSLNPRKSSMVTNAIVEVFGELQSTKHYVGAEYGNKWTTKGEDVLSVADVKLVMSPALKNEEGSSNKCVAFLDTSTTVEKTSLVILAEDPEKSTKPWEHVYLSRLEYWWPGHNMKAKHINGDEVKIIIESLMPLYPNLLGLHVDTKMGSNAEIQYKWPLLMLRDLRNGSGLWRRKIQSWRGKAAESDIGWDQFIERVNDGTITLPVSQEILQEIKGIMLVVPKSGDKGARIKDRNRNVVHKDITEAIACCCYLIKHAQLYAASGSRLSGQARAQRTVQEVLRGGTRSAPGPRMPTTFDPSRM